MRIQVRLRFATILARCQDHASSPSGSFVLLFLPSILYQKAFIVRRAMSERKWASLMPDIVLLALAVRKFGRDPYPTVHLDTY